MDVARMLGAVVLLAAVMAANAGQAVTVMRVSVNVVAGCPPVADPGAPACGEAPREAVPAAVPRDNAAATEPVPMGWIRFTHLRD